ncbi:unnamed protein product [Cochlearia groenlandica]
MLGVEENFVESGREKWPGKQNFCRENFVEKTLSRFVEKTLSRFVESLSRVCRGLSRFIESAQMVCECTAECTPRSLRRPVIVRNAWTPNANGYFSNDYLLDPSSLFTCSPCNGNKRDSLGPLPLTTS